jgi:GMP synthase (glutamine-hydrolysing)
VSGRFVVLQHIGCEPAAAYEDVLRDGGHEVVPVLVAAGDALPDPGGCAGIVAMGSPASVADAAALPWLRAEIAWIGEAVRAGVPYWGVCFGAQLLAAALGARVFRGPVAEVGVLPVELTAAGTADPVFGALPRELPAVQWHSDTFELPPGAVHLARSDAYPNQAFRWGRAAYGLQFHVEAPAALVAEWLAVPAYAAALAATLGPGTGAGFIAAIRAREAEMTAHARRAFALWLASGPS